MVPSSHDLIYQYLMGVSHLKCEINFSNYFPVYLLFILGEVAFGTFKPLREWRSSDRNSTLRGQSQGRFSPSGSLRQHVIGQMLHEIYEFGAGCLMIGQTYSSLF